MEKPPDTTVYTLCCSFTQG